MEKQFKIKFIDCTEESLKNIGFDKTYTQKGIEKHLFKSIKICGLNCAQANIIKQTAIACGTDCSVHREVITGKVELSDCILSGSISELNKIAEKLSRQPFSLTKLAKQLLNSISQEHKKITIRNKTFEFGQKTYLMGILNVTPDSFSDGGKYNTIATAVNQFKILVKAGAHIIDIGGESTRPNASTITVEEEISRVIPAITAIREFDKETVISIDTRNATTAQKALDAGADIINEISGVEWDEKMMEVLKNTTVPFILTHSMNVENEDIIDEIYDYFTKKLNTLKEAGIDLSRVIIDPGIGFNKNTEQNIEIIKRIKELKTLGYPILVGHSRKRFLQQTVNSQDADILDSATAFVSEKLIAQNIEIIRVHNVEIHKQLLKINNSLL